MTSGEPARTFSAEQRRARLGHRHRLAERADDAVAATRAMVVLHATDPATVFLSAAARVEPPSIDDTATALYDDRTLIRVLAMRRTLFVVPTDDLAMVERSSTDRVGANERKRLERFLADSGIDDPSGWLAEAEAEIDATLSPDGAAARRITTDVPRLATKIVMGAGTKHSTTTGATSRVLGVLANEGVLVRGRPAGAWTGRQYQWYLRRHWLGADSAIDSDTNSSTADHGAQPSEQDASVELVTRWLRTFGPAPLSDIKWWTGWTMGQLRTAVAEIDTAEVDLDGEPGLVLADDLDDDPEPAPWAALLPALDSTPMGWKSRHWYLGDHERPLFDRFGNIGPTVWADGRIVGGWAQTSDGSVVVELLEDPGTDHRVLIDTEIERLSGLLGDTVVKPSFPTPLQKELAAGP